MKSLAVLLAFLIGTAASSQAVMRAGSRLAATPDTTTVEQLVKQRSAVRPMSVITEGGASSFVFPVGINSPGKNGTFFKTDAVISNNRGLAQDILVAWLPAGVSGIGLGLTRYTLDASTVYFLSDFLGTGAADLNKSGVGSIMVTGVLAGTSTVDTDAFLDGAVRIWTFEPGSSGTNSFNMAPTSDSVSGTGLATALGLRQDAGFRTNVGIVNLDSVNSHTWAVRVVGVGNETTFPVTVPPLSMQQVAVPSSVDYGDIFVEFTPDSGSFSWSAYGVSADNITGDAWSSRAVQ
jgi:hypothetical protein